MKIRRFFSNPKGGTPPLVYETCYRVTIISQLSHKPSIKTKLEKSVRGFRSDGSAFTVESIARYLMHDPVHHLWDVGAEIPSLGSV
ncbi:MAG: hypothetical protein EB111_05220 [Actinobacteria bacterium]|nr:hypothetical protein [Actinomycetota bacterium]